MCSQGFNDYWCCGQRWLMGKECVQMFDGVVVLCMIASEICWNRWKCTLRPASRLLEAVDPFTRCIRIPC